MSWYKNVARWCRLMIFLQLKANMMSPEDPVYQHAVLGPTRKSQVNLINWNVNDNVLEISSKISLEDVGFLFKTWCCFSQRSLGSILLPPAPVGFKRMRREQEKAFEKRSNDQSAVQSASSFINYICQALNFTSIFFTHVTIWFVSRPARATAHQSPFSTGFAPFWPLQHRFC